MGEWIPEPPPGRAHWITGRPGEATGDPADRVTLDESVSMAFLVVLEAMTPAERVAFILHDVFCHSFAEVAEILGRTPAACRQLASSACGRIRAAQAPAASAARQAGLLRDFKKAWEAKDINALIALLDPDATAIADSGGLVQATLLPIEGAAQIARACLQVADMVGDLTIRERMVNGQPGLVIQQDGVTVTVLAFAFAGDRITHMWAVRNPDKAAALDNMMTGRGEGIRSPSTLDNHRTGLPADLVSLAAHPASPAVDRVNRNAEVLSKSVDSAGLPVRGHHF